MAKKKKKTQKIGTVLRVSSLPYGFEEEQMREFFSQFGKVTRLKNVRSRKTGRCCGFAFVEFRSSEVAKIAASTMNNYLLFDKILRCSVVSSSELQRNTFLNWKTKVKGHKACKMHVKETNAYKSSKTIENMNKRIYSRMKKCNARILKKGIDYQFQIPLPPYLTHSN